MQSNATHSRPSSSAVSRGSGQTNTHTSTLITPTTADPQLSTAKRQQRTQAFASHMNRASFERQVATAQTAKLELESKLREKELLIERLEGDRRWLAEREKEEREEKEREREEHAEEKVRPITPAPGPDLTSTVRGKPRANYVFFVARSQRCVSSTSIWRRNTRYSLGALRMHSPRRRRRSPPSLARSTSSRTSSPNSNASQKSGHARSTSCRCSTTS